MNYFRSIVVLTAFKYKVAMRAHMIRIIVLLVCVASSVFGQSPWERKLRQQLPLLGHRNWIVIADSAYPLQTATGIETVHTDTAQLEVVKTVLSELAKSRHVKPIVYTDAELKYVSEKNAPGVSAYRDDLNKILKDTPPQVLAHEEIIAKLDNAGKTFKVLLIKTPLTVPYTSVFIQLDCGYWNAEAEKELRDAMKGGGKN